MRRFFLKKILNEFTTTIFLAIMLVLAIVQHARANDDGSGTAPDCTSDPNGADCNGAPGAPTSPNGGGGGDEGAGNGGGGSPGSAFPTVSQGNLICNPDSGYNNCVNSGWFNEDAGLVLLTLSHSEFHDQHGFDRGSWGFLWDYFGEMFNCIPAVFGQLWDNYKGWEFVVNYGSVGWDDANAELCEAVAN